MKQGRGSEMREKKRKRTKKKRIILFSCNTLINKASSLTDTMTAFTFDSRGTLTLSKSLLF